MVSRGFTTTAKGQSRSIPEVPADFKGSMPEYVVFNQLLRFGLRPNQDFQFQARFAGGKIEKGGLVIDFLFNNPPNLAVNVQGVYYHYELGADTRARDIFARESLAGQGITLIFVDEDYLAQDPLGTTREALQFRDSSRLGRS